MEVDEILSARQDVFFLPGELGEVCCRVVLRDDEPRVAVVCFKCRQLTEKEEGLLVALQSFLVNALKNAHYRVTKKPNGDE